MTISTTRILIRSIRLVDATQPRAQMSQETIDDYAAAMTQEEGAAFPPIVVFRDESPEDGKLYWLADGFHRVYAAMQVGLEDFLAEVHEGGLRDAILYSVSANATHGLRRTTADKRQAVLRLLRDEEWRRWSDREIARLCAVDHKTVGRIREELAATGEIPSSEERRYTRDGKEQVMKTRNIGAAAKASANKPRWLHTWERQKRKHPDQVVFARVGRSATQWIAFDEDAERISRIIGVISRRIPVAGGWVQAIKLYVPEPWPAWFRGLYLALDTHMLHYQADDHELKMIADTLLPTAAIHEGQAAALSSTPSGASVHIPSETAGADDGGESGTEPSPEGDVAPYELYTPAWLVDRIRHALGGKIDLDPASCGEAQKVIQARFYYTIAHDGLSQPWTADTVFLNWPYGNGRNDVWANKALREHESGNARQMLVLVPSYTGAPWFRGLADYPRCFLAGRVDFYGPADKGMGASFYSVVIGLGVDLDLFAEAFEDKGDIYVRYRRD